MTLTLMKTTTMQTTMKTRTTMMTTMTTTSTTTRLMMDFFLITSITLHTVNAM